MIPRKKNVIRWAWSFASVLLAGAIYAAGSEAFNTLAGDILVTIGLSTYVSVVTVVGVTVAFLNRLVSKIPKQDSP